MYDQLPEVASIDAIARRAGVARSTVYLVFGSRAGLFDALTRDVLDRGGFDEVIRAVEDPDPLVHLRGSMLASVRVYAAQRDVLSTLRSIEHSLDGAMRRAEQGRLGGMEHLARRLADKGLLSVPELVAVDVLWMLTSFEAFDVLYTGRGLPADEVAARLVTTAERSLLHGPG